MTMVKIFIKNYAKGYRSKLPNTLPNNPNSFVRKNDYFQCFKHQICFPNFSFYYDLKKFYLLGAIVT